MKKILVALMLCLISIASLAEIKDLGNGWKFINTANEIEGLYYYDIDPTIRIKMYISTSNNDTYYEFRIESKDDAGNSKIYKILEEKATFYFDVFQEGYNEYFSILRFSYNDRDEMTTGFSLKGQNDLAGKVVQKLLNGVGVKFIASKSLAEFQEIKEFILPPIYNTLK